MPDASNASCRIEAYLRLVLKFHRFFGRLHIGIDLYTQILALTDKRLLPLYGVANVISKTWRMYFKKHTVIGEGRGQRQL